VTAGVALRVWAYSSTIGTPNSDEAVVGLMARRVLDGELTAIFWGQEYGGTQEVLLTAPLFAAVGSSWLALRLVPFVLNVAAAVLVWRVGRRTLGEPAATAAACLFWVWPPFNVFVLTHQHGFYASNVVYCALLLLLALRVVERPDAVRVGTFGLVLGLAFWQTVQIVPIASGVVAWILWRQPRSLRELPVATAAAVVGASPWLIWNARHGWESLEQAGYGSYVQGLRELASPVLPMILGLRAPLSAELLIPSRGLTLLIYLALAALFVAGAIRARRRNASLLYVTAALFPLVYALAPKTSQALSMPRYVVVLTPVLALLIAHALTTYARAAIAVAVACAVSVVALDRMNDYFEADSPPATHALGLGPRHSVEFVPRDLGPLIDALDQSRLDRVYADYWLAHRLTFETRERIVAAESRLQRLAVVGGDVVPIADADPPRHPPYQRLVASGRHGFIFYRAVLSSVPRPLIATLTRHGYRPTTVAGRWVVYARP
jgi:hypothetical protein